VIDAIRRLLVPDTAGDPVTGLRWTRKATGKVSRELKRGVGISVSPKTVGRILRDVLKYSLRVNHKMVSSTKNPDRNRQFEKIQRMRATFARTGSPIVSVDSKKKEMVGQFKNAGRVWCQKATPVNDHDFRKDAVGMAVPYGLYDPQANRGHIVVGISHDTADFAVDALVDWWRRHGCRRYPAAKRLLILADNGGGNGSRNRAWKHRLQTRLADPFGLSVTVCHYPPGASKWNPIEHRLFSEVTKNWAGEPLRSYELVLNYIRTTTTKTGLRTTATLNRGDYPTKVKISDGQLRTVRLRPHSVLPQWNYTISPSPTRPRL
jgi:hypothetical protein